MALTKGQSLRVEWRRAMAACHPKDRDPDDHGLFVPWVLIEIAGQLADINESLKQLAGKGDHNG